jgi:hypothetical protein
MGKIVYHGTFSEMPPHEHGYPFHAGTEDSAEDRLNSLDEYSDEDEDNIPIGQIHAYEISDDAPTSKKMWTDPYFATIDSTAVPEHKENRIYPYTNRVEDKGSTSYVIPSSFVGSHVKHLGVQFQYLNTNSKYDRDAIYNGISAMVGGPFKRDNS